MPTLRLALAQLNVTVGDLNGNRRRIAEALAQARAWQVDVVVVPELAVCGYPPEDLLLKSQFVEANQTALARLLPWSQGLIAVVGFVERDRAGRLYNAAAVLADGRQVAVYHKQYLPNYGVFDEKRYFTPGTHATLLDVGGLRLGVTICEDLWEEQPSRQLAAAGCQLLLNLSASPYHAGKLSQRERLFAHRARRNRLAVAYCNLVGGQDELVFDGASLVLDASGRLLAQAAQFEEDLLVVDLRPSQVKSAPRRGHGMVIAQSLRKRPPLVRRPIRALSPLAEIYEALMLGLRDYVRKNGFEGVVLGLSGGIDSALTACLAVDALGAEHVVGMVMPSRFSSHATQADAKQLAATLRIRCEELSIEPLFQAYLHTLRSVLEESTAGGEPVSITQQNIQARIRGHLLMALSNRFGWLVLTTGNKSEMATGYTTLYGDMAGGLAVIKDVPKTLVYRLARYRNRRGLGAPIPESVFRRPPTAELAPHQTDQDTLPPYGMLDRILKAYVEEDRSRSQILARNRLDPGIVKRVIRMVDRSEYKRRQGPPGIKITPKAFGRDRRMPITNRYQQG
jgi:NAD+ synthase (glutamine-hydrolysing)